MDIIWVLFGVVFYLLFLRPSKPKSTIYDMMNDMKLSSRNQKEAEEKLNRFIDRLPEPQRTYHKRELFLQKNLQPFYWSEWLFWQVHPKAKWRFIINVVTAILIFNLMGGFSLGTLGAVSFLVGWVVFDIMFYRYQLLMQATFWNKEFCDKFLDN